MRGEPSTDEDEETEFKNGDPFKRLDYEELKKKVKCISIRQKYIDK